MNPSVRPPAPSWIERLPRRPLCDVPWLGRSAILSDGRVNFCCYSEAVVGNVNDHTLQEIWHGETMTRIRKSLVAQRLPKECQSNSCPIYRGDEHFYLLDRMDGERRASVSGTDDPYAEQRAQLAGSELVVDAERRHHGEPLNAELRLRCSAPWLAVDVFVGVKTPDARIVFLPELTPFPLPVARNVALGADQGVFTLPLLATTIDASIPYGTYEICVGLFVADSNPSVAVNCYWSTRRALTVAARA